MTRAWALCTCVVAGCASGSPSTGNTDGQPAHDAFVPDPDTGGETFVDAAIDAAPHIDAPADARPDAPPDAHPDAAVMIDAHPDAAVMIDAPCMPVVTELLANPAFDSTPVGTGWHEVLIQNVLGGPYPLITSDGIVQQSAPYQVWLGGITGEDAGTTTATDIFYQDVTVPPGTTQLAFTGYYATGTNETGTTVLDTATISLNMTNDSPLENVLSLSNLTNTNGTWTAFSKTFATPYAGMTVRLRGTSTNSFSDASNFWFDTFSLKATHCP